MKERIQGLVAGLLIGSLGFGGTVYAISGTRNISVTYDNIKVYKDNVLCELKDSNGSTIEPFIYNGTTYMPVRGTASLADMQVTWDGANKSVYLWDEMVPSGTNFMQECPPYETSGLNKYISTKGQSFEMAGEKYSDGMVSYSSSGYALFNLNSKYSTLECTVGHSDSYNTNRDRSVSFIVDGKVVQTVELEASTLPKKVSIPLKYGLQLKIIFSSGVGIGNMTVS